MYNNILLSRVHKVQLGVLHMRVIWLKFTASWQTEGRRGIGLELVGSNQSLPTDWPAHYRRAPLLASRWAPWAAAAILGHVLLAGSMKALKERAVPPFLCHSLHGKGTLSGWARWAEVHWQSVRVGAGRRRHTSTTVISIVLLKIQETKPEGRDGGVSANGKRKIVIFPWLYQLIHYNNDGGYNLLLGLGLIFSSIVQEPMTLMELYRYKLL